MKSKIKGNQIIEKIKCLEEAVQTKFFIEQCMSKRCLSQIEIDRLLEKLK